jgi:hypothetical protein
MKKYAYFNPLYRRKRRVFENNISHSKNLPPSGGLRGDIIKSLKFFKMKNLKFNGLLLLLSFGVVACNKSCDDTPNPANHVNQFTCKVNGTFWEAVPKERSIVGNDLSAQKLTGVEQISIIARNVSIGQTESIDISFWLLDTSTTSKVLDTNPYQPNSCGIYDLDSSKIRTVIIESHDKTSRIVKGKFAFTVYKITGNCMDTFRITDGAFNMRYQ